MQNQTFSEENFRTPASFVRFFCDMLKGKRIMFARISKLLRIQYVPLDIYTRCAIQLKDNNSMAKFYGVRNFIYFDF